MAITLVGLPKSWTAVDAAALRDFLATGTGSRFAFALLNMGPVATDRETASVPAERLVGRMQAYEHLIGVINYLASESHAVEKVATGGEITGAGYPDLDDASQWDEKPKDS